MNLAIWVFLGALFGWCASFIAKTDKHDSLFLNVIVGVVGALLGGVSTIRQREFSMEALLMAAVGAAMLLLIVHYLQKRIKDARGGEDSAL